MPVSSWYQRAAQMGGIPNRGKYLHFREVLNMFWDCSIQAVSTISWFEYDKEEIISASIPFIQAILGILEPVRHGATRLNWIDVG